MKHPTDANRRRLSAVLGRAAALALGTILALIVGEIGARSHLWLTARFPGRPLTVTLTRRVQEYDSRHGFRLTPNASARLLGPEFDTEVSINAVGLRQRRVIPYDRTPGRPRVLIVGDSFAFGHGVDEQARFSELMEPSLAGVEIVNMGVWATSTGQQFLLFEEEGLKYRPDLTILLYFVENIRRNATTERLQPDGSLIGIPRFVLDGEKLRLTNVPVPRPESLGKRDRVDDERLSAGVPIPFKHYLRAHSSLYRLVHRAFAGRLHEALRVNPIPFPEYDAGREEWQVTSALIREFHDVARRHGGDFLLAVVPTPEYVYKSYVEPIPNRLLRALAQSHGIRTVDLLPALKAHANVGAALYFQTDGHWTAEGHRVVATHLADYLRTHGITPSVTSGH